ncbi:MAG: T9SS C-terminal target domain-containing protein [Bacteroidetes bacterium CHB5]|nr:T9SS C-terminal target domain-containing protein [Bacteroidetes bacterium CHB5]
MFRSLWVFLCLIAVGAQAQTNRYFVFFKNKTGTPYSISQPQEFLSAASIARRQSQQIGITETDLPVNPAYVQQLKDMDVATYFTSRWWNGVLIEADAGDLPAISALEFVDHILLLAPGQKFSNGRKKKVKRKQDTSDQPLLNATQLLQLGIPTMHADGNRGEGISIAIFDSGFQGVDIAAPFALLNTDNRIKQTFNFVNNNTDVFVADDHGTEVLSVMAAYIENSYTGGAYMANYFLYLTEDVSSEYRIEEFNWTFAAEKADSAGVQIINSSLGYNEFDDSSMDYTKTQLDGQTAYVTRAARWAIERGIVVVCSAGNEGNNSWQLVTPPADATGILAVGSISAGGTRSSFSSVGPTEDDRIKPEVVALGSGTVVIRASGNVGTTSGTSLASPLVASLAAGVWQAYPEFTAQEIYEALTQSASQATSPDNFLGYGIPNYDAVVNYLREPEPPKSWLVYPNPVVGNAVKIQLDEIDNPIQITLFDSRGTRVSESTLEINWQNNPFEYDISPLLSGLYYVRVKSGTREATFRIMKQ